MPSAIVASMPTFAVVGTTPGGVGARLGSSGLPRAGLTIITSRAALARVALAHSAPARRDGPFDLGRVEDVDVVIDDDHVLEVHHGERREQRILTLARLLADRDD